MTERPSPAELTAILNAVDDEYAAFRQSVIAKSPQLDPKLVEFVVNERTMHHARLLVAEVRALQQELRDIWTPTTQEAEGVCAVCGAPEDVELILRNRCCEHKLVEFPPTTKRHFPSPFPHPYDIEEGTATC